MPDFVYSWPYAKLTRSTSYYWRPQTRVLTRAIDFIPFIYLKAMDIRFSSPPLEAPQNPAEITATGRNYDTYQFNQSLFDGRIRELEALIITRLTLRPDQV